MANPPSDPWRLFRDNRPLSTYVHLDSAAAGRASRKTLSMVAGYAEREAVARAYVAAVEAARVIAAGRTTLAELLGGEPGGIAFLESASAALAVLLRAWPLMAGSTVAVVPSEWGPAVDAFIDRGLRVAQLAVDGSGLVDLDALRHFVALTPPAFVHLTLVASHRPLVQPVAEAVSICHAAGVPVWVDAAQALGHVGAAWHRRHRSRVVVVAAAAAACVGDGSRRGRAWGVAGPADGVPRGALRRPDRAVRGSGGACRAGAGGGAGAAG